MHFDDKTTSDLFQRSHSRTLSKLMETGDCPHDVVFAGMCAHCGIDMDALKYVCSGA